VRTAYKIIWSARSIKDLERIYNFLSELNPYAAARIIDTLLDRGTSLKWFPNRGHMGLRGGTRELVVRKRYVIVYRVKREHVQIVRVLDGKRRKEKTAGVSFPDRQ
jgi:addiction module RelE/StbE family toxin